MKIVNMSLSERVSFSRRHNPRAAGIDRKVSMTNKEMEEIILNLYGLKKLNLYDPLDLTFVVEDDKKYMMYLLRGLV
jgi:hypothetical protein